MNDPQIEQYERLLSRFTPGSEPPLLMVVGLGQGSLLDAIERRGLQTKVLAIEPVPEIVEDMRARRDWTPWLEAGRLTMIVGPAFAGIAEAWKLLGSAAATPPMIVSPSLLRDHPQAVDRAKAMARQVVLGAVANQNARRHLAGRYLLNTLSNLAVVASEGDVSSLAGTFHGVPAIIVGAGPSLDRNLPDLRQAADRALLIAVDTALRPLLAADIRPHIVVAVDPSEDNARHLLGLPAVGDIHFVAEASLDPRVFASFAGRTFAFKVSAHHPWPWLAALDADRGSLRAWGSVLTTAFDLARVCGCTPIVFAGADLAYTDGSLYCHNTVYEPEWAHLKTGEARADEFRDFLAKQTTVMEADVSGKQTLTAPRFVQFRDWIVRESATAGGVLNATGAGILHGGSIVQANLSLALRLLPREAGDLLGRMEVSWNVALESRRHQKARIRAALDEVSSLPLDQWLEFGGETVSREDLDGALRRAARGLDKAVPRSEAGYLAMRQDCYEESIHSLHDAQVVVHPDFDYARQQASASQSHLLLDFLQRSYAVQPQASVHGTLLAASSIRGDVRALDIGCGVGRGMEPLASAGIKVDGVDISARMLAFARENPRLADSRFFHTSGESCGAAPEGEYDLVYSQMCLQHIPSRAIRNKLLASMARVLRPGGVVFVQMHFYNDRSAGTVPSPHVPWHADDFDAPWTGGAAEVWVTPDALPLLLEDFSRHFVDLRLQFVDFAREASLHADFYNSWFSHLIVSGSTKPELAARMYAPIIKPAA